jgi:hypothetical protein
MVHYFLSHVLWQQAVGVGVGVAPGGKRRVTNPVPLPSSDSSTQCSHAMFLLPLAGARAAAVATRSGAPIALSLPTSPPDILSLYAYCPLIDRSGPLQYLHSY